MHVVEVKRRFHAALASQDARDVLRVQLDDPGDLLLALHRDEVTLTRKIEQAARYQLLITLLPSGQFLLG